MPGTAVFQAEVEEDFGELVGGLLPACVAAADDEEALGVGVLDVLLHVRAEARPGRW